MVTRFTTDEPQRAARTAQRRFSPHVLIRRPGFWIAVVALAAVTVFVGVRARGPSVRTVVTVRRDLEQHIVASGRVWVPTRVQVSAQVPGLVVAVGVIEAQHVKAGDLLVQLDDAEERTAVAQANASVEQARARVDQLRRVGAIVATEGLRQAQTNLDHAQGDLDRALKLAATGAVPQTELDDARHALDLARAQKAAAEAQQISAAPMGADSRVALSALLQAQAQLEGAKVRLTETRLVALHDGTVLSRSVEPGDTVQPGRTLLVLATDSDTQLVLQADERNLATLALGQKARASADAYPASVFDAVVSYVAPSIDPQRGSVEVRLRVPDAPKYLKPDMTVSVDVAVAEKRHALTAPSEAVRGAGTSAPWVFAVEEGRVVEKQVTLGIRGEGSVEITSGIGEGVDLVLPDRQLLAHGQRVRPSREER